MTKSTHRLFGRGLALLMAVLMCLNLVCVSAFADYTHDHAAFCHVFVPVMFDISASSGDQYARMQVDWTSLTKIDNPETNAQPHYHLGHRGGSRVHLDGHHRRERLQILRLIRRLNREFGITIIMVLHDINQSLYYSDEIVAMQDGRIRAQGLPEQIITPELVRSVYDVELEIREVDGKPFVIPV